jgi:uncharacterized membrane protein
MDDALIGGLIGGGTMLVSGLVIMWLAGRMATGRLRRNMWAGIRTPSTMKSDEAWNAAHEAAAHLTNVAGILAALGGLTGMTAGLLGFGPGVVTGLILGGAVLMLIVVLVAAVKGVRVARHVE